MKIRVNDFINFDGMFTMLYVQSRGDLINESEYVDNPHYRDIHNFYENMMLDYTILSDECELVESECENDVNEGFITFVFKNNKHKFYITYDTEEDLFYDFDKIKL